MKVQTIGVFLALGVWSASATADTETLRLMAAHYESSVEASLIPRDALIRNQTRSDVVMSPSGRHVLLINRNGPVTDLTLLGVPDLKAVFDMQSDVLRTAQWNREGTALVLEMGNSIAVAQLPDLRPAYIARLDRAAGDYFLGPDTQSADHVLMIRKQDNNFRLERISFGSDTTEVLSSDQRIVDAIVSTDLSRTFARTISPTGQHIAMHQSGVILPILECGPLLVDECSIDAYSASDNMLWLRSNVNQNLTGLYSWNPSDSSLTLHHIDPDATSDLWNVRYTDNQPVLAQYYGEQLQNYSLVDYLNKTIQQLSATRAGKSVNIHPSAGEYWLLEYSSTDSQQNTYQLLHVATGDLQPIRHPKLASAATDLPLTEKLPFSYPANDGRILHGYVSLPRGKTLAEAPLIALVHGGPFSRTYANYSSLTQLLTNRGFIVVEPNFRGSTGYGRDYLMSSNKDFGDGQVQRDIDASIEYILDQGLGDLERVAIAGASFGGYSALTGLAFSSDLYQLGIAISAPADLVTSLRHQMQAPGFGVGNPSAGAGMKALMVDLQNEREVERLEQQSPLNNLHAIQSPLLIFTAAGDPAVDINHVRDFAARLAQQDTPIALFVNDGSVHGYENSDAIASIFAAIENFLSLYFDTRSEPIGSALREELSQKLVLHRNPDFIEEIE